MFHPAKILEIYSPKDKNVRGDETTLATVETWDENMFTLLVDDVLANKIAKNDIVLMDYRPISEKAPFPRQIITKVLKGSKGKEIWKKYKEYLKKMKNKGKIQIQKQAKYPKSPKTQTFAG